MQLPIPVQNQNPLINANDISSRYLIHNTFLQFTYNRDISQMTTSEKLVQLNQMTHPITSLPTKANQRWYMEWTPDYNTCWVEQIRENL